MDKIYRVQSGKIKVFEGGAIALEPTKIKAVILGKLRTRPRYGSIINYFESFIGAKKYLHDLQLTKIETAKKVLKFEKSKLLDIEKMVER